MTSTIYGIYFFDTTRIEYVGAAGRLKTRERMHRESGHLRERPGVLTPLCVAHSKQQQVWMETAKIAYFDTYLNGLNKTFDGRGGQRGENHWNYGKKASSSTRAKISAATRGKNNPMYGRTGDKSPCYGRTGELNPMYKYDSPAICEDYYNTDLSPQEVMTKNGMLGMTSHLYRILRQPMAVQWRAERGIKQVKVPGKGRRLKKDQEALSQFERINWREYQ